MFTNAIGRFDGFPSKEKKKQKFSPRTAKDLLVVALTTDAQAEQGDLKDRNEKLKD